jgi:hypothetical protein
VLAKAMEFTVSATASADGSGCSGFRPRIARRFWPLQAMSANDVRNLWPMILAVVVAAVWISYLIASETFVL